MAPLSAFGLPSPVPVWEALFLTVLSYGVGVLGGIIGLALGTMRLPFLLLLGLPAPVGPDGAHGHGRDLSGGAAHIKEEDPMAGAIVNDLRKRRTRRGRI